MTKLNVAFVRTNSLHPTVQFEVRSEAVNLSEQICNIQFHHFKPYRYLETQMALHDLTGDKPVVVSEQLGIEPSAPNSQLF